MFSGNSMHTVVPVLSQFCYIGIHQCIDICSIFRFEPMHFILLGAGKNIKNIQLTCLETNVEQPVQFNAQTETENCSESWSERKFNHLTSFSIVDQKIRQDVDPKIYFSKFDCSRWLTGLVNEVDVDGMLEPTDCDSIGNVFLFWGCLVDSYCYHTKIGKTISSFTQYVTMMNFYLSFIGRSNGVRHHQWVSSHELDISQNVP